MRPHESRQSQAYLERVLDGKASSDGALGGLIAAARAPETHADPAGLAAALTVFREVSAHPSSNPRSTSMIKNVAAKVLAAKFLAVAGLAVAATGGVAAAASTGHLPSPLPHSSHASGTAVTAVAAHNGQLTGTPIASDSASASASASESSEPSSPHPAASPSPSLRGLCQAWLSRPHEHGKADTSPAFSYLVSTAGGIDSVDSYCTSLLAGPTASATPSDGTGEPGEPSAEPSHSHPSGKPSTVPSHSHGKPSPLPTPSAPPTRH
jgi:hypothetical protein